jgi:Fe2+ or Zn2+ uptake regulation protein
MVIIMKDYNTILKNNSLRMTNQRRVILQQLEAPNVHLTADDIYSRVREIIPNVSLGTVYRNLEILTRAGLLRKLHMAGNQKHYDGGLHRHYHVRCAECGRVSDVSAEPFGDINSAADAEGFDIHDHELEFTGVCHLCRGRQEN